MQDINQAACQVASVLPVQWAALVLLVEPLEAGPLAELSTALLAPPPPGPSCVEALHR